jgi:hypothetical protein
MKGEGFTMCWELKHQDACNGDAGDEERYLHSEWVYKSVVQICTINVASM